MKQNDKNKKKATTVRLWMVRLSYPQVSAIDGRVQGRAIVLVDVVEEALLRVTGFLS